MNEYDKFLKFFNKENGENEPLSEREDIIPLKGAAFIASAEEEKSVPEENQPPVTEEKADAADEEMTEAADEIKEEKTEEIKMPEKEDKKEEPAEGSDEIPVSGFIKSGDAQFIAVNAKNRNDCPTAAEKYTDRLLPVIPRKKSVEETPRKGSSYEQNHSPESENNFIPLDDAKKDEVRKNTDTAQTPENTAEEQLKIFPHTLEEKKAENEVSGVILEKKPPEVPEGETKFISRKGDLLREIAKSSDESGITNDGQMTMEGFEDEDIPIINTDDEEQLRRELKKVREKRIKNFKFWSKAEGETGESEDKSFSAQAQEKQLPAFLAGIRDRFSHLDTDFLSFGEEEFSDPSRRKEIFASLLNAKKTILIKTAIVALLGIVLTLINVSTSVSAAVNNGFFLTLGGSAAAYSAINLIFLLICGVLMLDELKKGLFSVLKVRPKTDSALLFMYLCALAQTIASFFSQLKPEYEYHLLSGAAITLCVPVLLAKVFYHDSTRHCFKVAGAVNDKCYMRSVSDNETVVSILKDRDHKNANLVYTGKTRFISGFLKRSASGAFAGQASSRVVIASVLASVVSGIIGLVISGSVVYALGCMCATSAISFPVSCLLFTGFALSNENSVLSVKSSFIGSFSDTYSFGCIDNILLDGEDVFSAEIVSSSCARRVPSKQAEFCAAVLTSKSGGMLGKAFSVFSAGLEDRFPEVESLEIEEKLGISAWISDCKVLLGTKEFLENHNVELPTDHSIPFISNEDTRPLFLAIEGHFAAVFSVKYSCDKIAADALSALAGKGTNILLTISDPNITEQFGEDLMGLPANSLKLISGKFSNKFELQRNTITNSEDTGIVFADSFSSFARTMSGAIRLERLRRTAKSLCEAASIAGILLGILAAATSALTLINGWPIIILHIFWQLLNFIVTPALCATTLKKKFALPENSPRASRERGAENETGSIDDLFAVKEEEKAEEAASDRSAEKADSAEEEKAEEEKADSRASAASEEKKEDAGTSQPPAQQMGMEEIYNIPPMPVIDFTSITGEEPTANSPSDDEAPKTVSDDILDMFADSSRPKEKAARTASRAPKKSGILSRLGLILATDRDDEDENGDAEEKTAPDSANEKKSVFSFADFKIPEPPKFYTEKPEEDENDPLKATFIPPESDAPSAIYNDSFFASFDTSEDDKAFEDVRRRRKAEEDGEGEFDFWTKK